VIGSFKNVPKSGEIRDRIDNQGSFRFVEHLADLGRETGEVERLHDQLDAGIESALMDDRILRITGREKDFQIASELSPSAAAWTVAATSRSIGPKPGSTSQPTPERSIRRGTDAGVELGGTRGEGVGAVGPGQKRVASALSRTLRAIGPTCQKRRGTRGQIPVIGTRPRNYPRWSSSAAFG
jgi:hypothetical protein